MMRYTSCVALVLISGCGQPTPSGPPVKSSQASLPASDGDTKPVKLGDTITLGQLQITPEKAEIRSVGWKRSVAWDRTETGDVLVVTVRVKNTSDGQVFPPMQDVSGTDSFGNSLISPFPEFANVIIEGSQDLDDLVPGGEARVLVCVATKPVKATHFILKVRSKVSNQDGSRRDWTLQIQSDQVTRTPQAAAGA